MHTDTIIPKNRRTIRNLDYLFDDYDQKDRNDLFVQQFKLAYKAANTTFKLELVRKLITSWRSEYILIQLIGDIE